MKYHRTHYGNAVWNYIVERISQRNLPIRYGDISESFFGNRKSGQTFATPLGEIHENIDRLNKIRRKSGRVLPHLNELVVRSDTGEVGSGAPGDPESAKQASKNALHFSIDQWIEAGKAIGYDTSVGHRKFKPSLTAGSPLRGTASLGDYGSLVEHKRKGTWVIPKHHPVCKAVELFFRRQKCKFLERENAGADFVLLLNGKKTVVEVKPDDSLQSIASGIGQLLVYGNALSTTELILAIPFSRIKSTAAITTALATARISILPVTYNSKGKIAKVVGHILQPAEGQRT